jgi:ABC-type lipoprotein export system ATPase subunit
MSTSYPRGSEWRKWDLHVHTPASAIAHTLGNNWDIFVEKLIDAAIYHDIHAIATADYFTIQGYRELQKYYNADTRILSVNDKEIEIFILPGVELRLNSFTRRNESINLHIFFDPDNCSDDFITQNFLEELYVKYRGATLPLKKQNLIAIGKSIAENTQFDPGQDFTRLTEAHKLGFIRKAIKTVTLSHNNLEDALNNIDSIFKKQKLDSQTYLTAVVGKGHGGIDSLHWFEENLQFSRAGLVREDLANQANIIFSNSINDREFYLGLVKNTPPNEVVSRFRHLKPCVWGSDAHSLDNLLHPSNGNTFDYTWIKSELSFEGLKQITFEPDLRVIIQQENPKEEEVFANIESLGIAFPNDLKIKDKGSLETVEFCINGDKSIDLSTNLTCIIGGRGSGKSTILHLLYNLLTTLETNRLTKVDSPLFNLNLESNDVLKEVRSLTRAEIPIKSEFFFQNEIEKSAKDINAMSLLIKNRLFGLSEVNGKESSLKNAEYSWQKSAYEFDEIISTFESIKELESEIELLSKEVSTLKKQSDVIKSKEYTELLIQIEKIANEISSFNSYTGEYTDIQKEVSILIINSKKLNWGKFQNQTVIDGFIKDLEKWQLVLKDAYSISKGQYDDARYEIVIEEKKNTLKEFLRQKGISQENIGELTEATQQISELTEQIQRSKKKMEEFREIYQNKSTIITRFKKNYSEYEERFNSVISILHSGLSEIEFDEQQAMISFDTVVDEEFIKDAIVEFIKSKNTSKVNLRENSLKTILFSNDSISISDIIEDQEMIASVIVNSVKADVHKQVLCEMISNPRFAERLHLHFLKYYYDISNIKVKTLLGGKSLQHTSFGERCGIVMAIVLVAGTNPIIIDQPEDNLDGRYISNVLVPLLWRQKKKRQIILATREANIVIGGDSELILILEKGDQGTSFLPSTIENISLRSKYIWILDGGENAFRKRESKYSICNQI